MVPESEEYGISSFVYHTQKPFVPKKIYYLACGNFFLQQRSEEGQADPKKMMGARTAGPFANVLRSKGFMWLATRPPNMGEWSQAGAILIVRDGGPWIPSLDLKKVSEIEEIGHKRNEIVFIGTFNENDRIEITKALDSCLVTDEQLDKIIKNEEIDNMYDPFDPWYSMMSVEDQFQGRVSIIIRLRNSEFYNSPFKFMFDFTVDRMTFNLQTTDFDRLESRLSIQLKLVQAMLMQEIQALLPKYELGMAFKYSQKLFYQYSQKEHNVNAVKGDEDFGKIHQEAMNEFQKMLASQQEHACDILPNK